MILKPGGLIAISNANGLFRFTNVPVSEHFASLDLSSLPPDFEAKARTFKFKVDAGQEITGLGFPVKGRIRKVKKIILSPIEGVQATPSMQNQ